MTVFKIILKIGDHVCIWYFSALIYESLSAKNGLICSTCISSIHSSYLKLPDSIPLGYGTCPICHHFRSFLQTVLLPHRLIYVLPPSTLVGLKIPLAQIHEPKDYNENKMSYCRGTPTLDVINFGHLYTDLYIQGKDYCINFYIMYLLAS